jgi:hypothetical protein
MSEQMHLCVSVDPSKPSIYVKNSIAEKLSILSRLSDFETITATEFNDAYNKTIKSFGYFRTTECPKLAVQQTLFIQSLASSTYEAAVKKHYT